MIKQKTILKVIRVTYHFMEICVVISGFIEIIEQMI